ncbi:hypothetical protein SDC9_208552 [bioreactor metagenome]|uniref:Uncharacterized protein n=1 Tax=bioreactor metagenome TaxID=1076179 RepID=A0A645JCN0_9ZZZZ
MREGHADSRKNQGDTGPERRLFLAVFLFTFRWREVNTGAFFSPAPVATQKENQAACNHQANDGRDDQRGKNTDDFRDVECVHH